MEYIGFMCGEDGLKLSDCVSAREAGRENLGAELPVAVYRLLEYSFREELVERFGKEEQVKIFRGAGYRAGGFFARNYLEPV